MGKPLLTDEVIAEAKQEANWEKHTQVRADLSERTVYKSRRIENAKRGAFQSRINRILTVLVVLLAILIYAMFKW